MIHGATKVFSMLPKLCLIGIFTYTALNVCITWLGYGGGVHLSINLSCLRKQSYFLERFETIVCVSRSALLKRWRQRIAFSSTHCCIKRDEASVLHNHLSQFSCTRKSNEYVFYLFNLMNPTQAWSRGWLWQAIRNLFIILYFPFYNYLINDYIWQFLIFVRVIIGDEGFGRIVFMWFSSHIPLPAL